MAQTPLPIPPSGILVINPITGAMDTQWQNYFNQLTVAIASTGVPPITSNFFIGRAEPTLTNAFNFGTLTTGLTVMTVSGGVAIPSTIPFAQSSYTPTLTNVTNITASTAHGCQYLRVGAFATVSGKVDIQPTNIAALTQLGISLPIASALTGSEQVAGAASAPVVTGYSGAILGDPVNGRAELDFTTATDVANRSWWFIFGYQIL
jgi:hypothetical protein